MQAFERVNLLPDFPGKHKRDDKFPMTQARFAATVLRPMLGGRMVVLIGRNVAQAFGIELPFHEWADVHVRRRCPVQRNGYTAKLAIVPHPSGRNHWYNEPKNVEHAKTFWAEVRAHEKVLSFVSA